MNIALLNANLFHHNPNPLLKYSRQDTLRNTIHTTALAECAYSIENVDHLLFGNLSNAHDLGLEKISPVQTKCYYCYLKQEHLVGEEMGPCPFHIK